MTYYHYIGEAKDSNDLLFVIPALEALLKSDALKGKWRKQKKSEKKRKKSEKKSEKKVKKKQKKVEKSSCINNYLGVTDIGLWSDGGRKHFKFTGTLSYISTIHNIKITYNFFESYHEQSACDAAASHAKKRVNTTIRDTPQLVRTANSLSTIISTLHHHHAQPIQVLAKSLKQTFKTFKGITSHYKFEFQNNTVLAYKTSEDIVAAKQFPVQDCINVLLNSIQT